MFDFIEKWDTTLKNVQQDLEFSIKGEVKSWVIHLQAYLEKLLKLYYYHSHPKDSKLTLGDLIRDQEFVLDFELHVGFSDINWIKNVNSVANDSKHNAQNREFGEDEINEWIRKAHKLSIAVYNACHQDRITENYDSDYVARLLKEKDESEESLIAYADLLISKRSQKIEALQTEVDSLKNEIRNRNIEIGKAIKNNRKLQTKIEHYQKEIFYYDNIIHDIFLDRQGIHGIQPEYLDRTRNDVRDIYNRIMSSFQNVVAQADLAKYLYKNQETLEEAFDKLVFMLDDNIENRELLKQHIRENLEIHQSLLLQHDPESYQKSFSDPAGCKRLARAISIIRLYVNEYLAEKRKNSVKLSDSATLCQDDIYGSEEGDVWYNPETDELEYDYDEEDGMDAFEEEIRSIMRDYHQNPENFPNDELSEKEEKPKVGAKKARRV